MKTINTKGIYSCFKCCSTEVQNTFIEAGLRYKYSVNLKLSCDLI